MTERIELLNLEADKEGGWLVRWRDPENLDGGPIIAYFHLEVDWLYQIMKAREKWNAPFERWEAALPNLASDTKKILDFPSKHRPVDTKSQKDLLGIPEEVIPYVVRDTLDDYEQHINDCIDRVKLNLRPEVTHEELEHIRQLDEIPGLYQLDVNANKLEQFIQRQN